MKRTQNSLDSKQVLSVIEKYSTALDLLDAYDHQNMTRPSGIERTKLTKIKDMLSWGVVSAGDVLIAKGYDEEVQLLANGHVSFNNEEMSMQDWLKRMTGWKSVETYKLIQASKVLTRIVPCFASSLRCG